MCERSIPRTRKKLIDVARWFVGDLAAYSTTTDNDEAHFGAPTKTKAQSTLTVLPANWLAVNALCTANTQWQFDKNEVERGLNYQGAHIAWQLADITLTPVDFEKVQFLERTIIALVRKTHEQHTEPCATLEL